MGKNYCDLCGERIFDELYDEEDFSAVNPLFKRSINPPGLPPHDLLIENICNVCDNKLIRSFWEKLVEITIENAIKLKKKNIVG